MMSSASQILQISRQGDSFSAQTTAMLGQLLMTAFAPLIGHPVLSLPLQSFMSSSYIVMMTLCVIALVVDVSFQGGVRFHFHWSEIVETISILKVSLAVISLIWISNPYIALVLLLVWLFFAVHFIHILIQVLNQPISPIAINTNSVNTVFGMMKN